MTTDLINLMMPFFCVVAFVLGSCMGSFLECLTDRASKGISIVKKTHSFCPSCNHELKTLDLVPVFSYIFLGGKCRYCKTKIPARHLVCELILGFTYLTTVICLKISIETAVVLLISSVLFAASLSDLATMTVSDKYFIVLAVLFIPYALVNIFVYNQPPLAVLMQAGLGGVLVPALLLLVAVVLEKIIGKETIGGADIKLLFAVGLYLGFAKSILNIIVTCIVGLIVTVIAKKKKDAEFPLVPSIAISTFICLLAGDYIINWYLQFFNY